MEAVRCHGVHGGCHRNVEWRCRHRNRHAAVPSDVPAAQPATAAAGHGADAAAGSQRRQPEDHVPVLRGSE
ncbi:hypothetical protein SDC9_169393 [bioreactor metagenome]|uniref:Uncharacterized protein n=1 Tax=bioreactor metagenome TaxID=1076179 RepID=A0A645G7P5_9ZZZZ